MANQSLPSIISHFVGAPSQAVSESALQHLLRCVRQHLGMEVAFVSEFAGDQQVFRQVDSASAAHPLTSIAGHPLKNSYCHRVAHGQMPGLVPDMAKCVEAADLVPSTPFPIGAYLSVPIRFSDGRLYGSLCCLSPAPDPELNARDLGFLRAITDLVAGQIEKGAKARQEREAIHQRIQGILSGEGLSIAYQPIHDLAGGRVVGFEALSRFAATPYRSPDVWFAEAAQAGLGVALEIKAIRLALQGLQQLPDDVYVAVNASPETVLSRGFDEAFSAAPLERVVLEITEHALIKQYEELGAATKALRSRGVRIAVDDAGAGYASFRHVLNLAPEKIKLDMSLTRDIDTHRSRQALAAALVTFAERTGSMIVAEGVETAEELSMLKRLGIVRAQGYLLGKPMPLAQARLALQYG